MQTVVLTLKLLNSMVRARQVYRSDCLHLLRDRLKSAIVHYWYRVEPTQQES
jgi:hypothetical protein